MSTSNTTTKGQTHPSQHRYPAELRERAVRMVREATVEGDLLVAPDGRVTTLAVVAEEQRARRAAQRLLDAPPGDAPSEETVRRAVEEAAQHRRSAAGSLRRHAETPN